MATVTICFRELFTRTTKLVLICAHCEESNERRYFIQEGYQIVLRCTNCKLLTKFKYDRDKMCAIPVDNGALSS